MIRRNGQTRGLPRRPGWSAESGSVAPGPVGERAARVEYEITELGRSLSTVFAALGEWSAAHLPEVEKSRAAYQGPLPR